MVVMMVMMVMVSGYDMKLLEKVPKQRSGHFPSQHTTVFHIFSAVVLSC